MNTKRLVSFILWAFLPMAAIGLVMHFSGTSAVGLPGFIVLLITDTR